MSTEQSISKTLRKTQRQQLTRLVNQASDILAQETISDVDELHVLISRIKVSNTALSEVSNNLIRQEDLTEEELEEECDKLLDYEDKAVTAISRLERRAKKEMENKIIDRSNFPNTDENVGYSRRSQPKSKSIKLPKLELLKFDGNLNKWPAFWEQFKSTIHENEELDDGSRFNYLQSLLTGKAALSIKGLTPSETLYNEAIEMLKKEFGNTQKIIDSHIQTLLQLTPVRGKSDITSLRHLYNMAVSTGKSLEALGISPEQYALMVKSLVMRNLPYYMRIEFNKELSRGRLSEDLESNASNESAESCRKILEDLLHFLKIEIESVEQAKDLDERPNHTKGNYFDKNKYYKRSKENVSTAAGLLTSVKEACLFCSSKSHETKECNGQLTLDQRKNVLKNTNRCFRCTRRNHNSKNCRTRDIKCRKCEGRHVTALCDPNYNKQITAKINKDILSVESNLKESQSTSQLFAGNRIDNIFLQTACAYVSTNNKKLFVRMVIDSGAQITFIKESISRSLGLQVIGEHNLSVVPFGTTKRTPARKFNKVKLVLEGQYSGDLIEITAVEIPEICFDSLQIPNVNDPKFKGLNLADARITGQEPVEGISILIGSDHYWKIVTGEIYRLSEKLVIVNTRFGWTIHGQDESRGYEIGMNLATVLRVAVENESADMNIKQFWELQTIGIKGIETENQNNFADEYAKNNVSFDGNKYEVCLPWKHPSVEIINSNYFGALARVKTLTNNLLRHPDKFLEYDHAMREYIDQGYAERAMDIDDDFGKINKLFFLPHRAVERPDKESTRIRVVFNGSVKPNKNADSLNDLLYAGENMIPQLMAVLLNFRIGRIAITADIEKAFLQIKLKKEDRDSHSFLWYESPIDLKLPLPKLIRYRMSCVTFGITCSPFLLAVCLQKHFNALKVKYPSTCEILKRSFYVDDLVLGVNDLEQAKTIYNDSKQILSEANMNLRKWKTNDKELNKLFEKGNELKGRTKILGILWDTNTDKICFDISDCLQENTVTKRIMLGTVAKIYDPFNVLGPFVLRGKLLIQDVWKCNLAWDNTPPEEILKNWNEWCSEFDIIKNMSIPRGCVYSDTTPVQLHVFADSSIRSYGCVSYLRYRNDNDEIECRFIIAKQRLAPIDKKGDTSLTLPKLELTAALSAARLKDYIIRNVKLNINEIILWSDSRITLSWIKGSDFKLKPYVKNRVKEIRNLSENVTWRHCPGASNPADMLTRPVRGKTLVESKMWKNGPEFLMCDEQYWPCSDNNKVSDLVLMNIISAEEPESNMLSCTELKPILPLKSYSDFEKVLRITAYAIRFIKNLKNKLMHKPINFGRITVSELINAELYWIKLTQQQNYLNEVQCLTNNKPISLKSPILCLNPFMDSDGVMRVKGRLQETAMDYDAKHPVILPKDSDLSSKLVWTAHQKVAHGGTNATLAQCRRRFWIIKGRQLIKSLIKHCILCKRLKGLSGNEQFAPLPACRITNNVKPFSATGVDFFGPLYVTEGHNKYKVYVMLLTCAVIRAVHLELVRDLTSESCILGLRRFFAKRGLPNVIYSDNAKTFKRASLELRQLSKVMNCDEIQDLVSRHRIKWKFIVERAAWWGGFWERLVRSVKNCLKITIGRSKLNYDQLGTVLTEIESVINSRPLTYIDNEPNDLTILTPSHFLNGSDISNLCFKFKVNANRNDILKCWNERLKLISKFWKHWCSDYLQQLRSFHHVRPTNVRRIQQGDVALLHDAFQPRIHWKLVRILKVFPGRDGLVRSCEIRTPSGTILKRPIQLLYPFEIYSSAGEDVENMATQHAASTPVASSF